MVTTALSITAKKENFNLVKKMVEAAGYKLAVIKIDQHGNITDVADSGNITDVTDSGNIVTNIFSWIGTKLYSGGQQNSVGKKLCEICQSEEGKKDCEDSATKDNVKYAVIIYRGTDVQKPEQVVGFAIIRPRVDALYSPISDLNKKSKAADHRGLLIPYLNDQDEKMFFPAKVWTDDKFKIKIEDYDKSDGFDVFNGPVRVQSSHGDVQGAHSQFTRFIQITTICAQSNTLGLRVVRALLDAAICLQNDDESPSYSIAFSADKNGKVNDVWQVAKEAGFDGPFLYAKGNSSEGYWQTLSTGGDKDYNGNFAKPVMIMWNTKRNELLRTAIDFHKTDNKQEFVNQTVYIHYKIQNSDPATRDVINNFSSSPDWTVWKLKNVLSEAIKNRKIEGNVKKINVQNGQNEVTIYDVGDGMVDLQKPITDLDIKNGTVFHVYMFSEKPEPQVSVTKGQSAPVTSTPKAVTIVSNAGNATTAVAKELLQNKPAMAFVALLGNPEVLEVPLTTTLSQLRSKFLQEYPKYSRVSFSLALPNAAPEELSGESKTLAMFGVKEGNTLMANVFKNAVVYVLSGVEKTRRKLIEVSPSTTVSEFRSKIETSYQLVPTQKLRLLFLGNDVFSDDNKDDSLNKLGIFDKINDKQVFVLTVDIPNNNVVQKSETDVTTDDNKKFAEGLSQQGVVGIDFGESPENSVDDQVPENLKPIVQQLGVVTKMPKSVKAPSSIKSVKSAKADNVENLVVGYDEDPMTKQLIDQLVLMGAINGTTAKKTAEKKRKERQERFRESLDSIPDPELREYVRNLVIAGIIDDSVPIDQSNTVTPTSAQPIAAQTGNAWNDAPTTTTSVPISDADKKFVQQLGIITGIPGAVPDNSDIPAGFGDVIN